MARRNIAAGNWKMNTTVSEGVDLLNALGKTETPSDVTVILGAPYIHLHAMLQAEIKDIYIAAQNCHHKEKGAYTGEVSPTMLTDLGIQYVILGHSERRAYNHEDNTLLKEKVDAALAAGLNVIFCCGEPLEIRKENTQNAYVGTQLSESLSHLTVDQMKNIVIAYEPIWAIGTGETASPEQAQDMHAYIRNMLAETFDKETAENTSILYGGSVKPANAKEIFGQADVDGGLVGGASLKTDDFSDIIHSF